MPALLLRFLPYIAAGLALFAAVAWYGHKCDQSGYRRAQAHMAASVAKAEAATKAAEANARAITEAKDREWQTERDNLQGRITGLLSKPAPAIRLCRAADRSELPAVPTATGEHDAAAGVDGSGLRAGEDIGGAALVFAGKCERDRRQLSALQGWVAEQAH